MDRKGATEENCTRIHAIDAWEALGYRSCGQEEHTGAPREACAEMLSDELADNRPAQIAIG